uniref:Cilia and flagella associated protein 298 n=3 Tax=Pan troglodytes TaxID=9598 RepID=H2QKY6_PANTR
MWSGCGAAAAELGDCGSCRTSRSSSSNSHLSPRISLSGNLGPQTSRLGGPPSPSATWSVFWQLPRQQSLPGRGSANLLPRVRSESAVLSDCVGGFPGRSSVRAWIAGPRCTPASPTWVLSVSWRECSFPRSPRARERGIPDSERLLVRRRCWRSGDPRPAGPAGHAARAFSPPQYLGGTAMVLLHVKRGDESQFLLQAPGSTELEELTVQVARVYNGRLKVQRLCSEMEELAEHGIFLPPNMQGLTDDQIEELKLKDEWGEKCVPSGGAVFKKDDIGRRNGQAPNEKMKQVLKKTIEEAKAIISKKQVEAGICVTMEMVKDALDQLRGAVMIVYPMGLPPYDPIRMEFENKEDLSGTQAGLNVIKEAEAQLWWAAKELRRTKKLSDYVGKNEKTKIIAKIQQRGQGAPAREPIISSEEQKQLMLYYHRRQEELKRLEENDDDAYLNSPWADNTALKRHFHGVKDIKWRPR